MVIILEALEKNKKKSVFRYFYEVVSQPQTTIPEFLENSRIAPMAVLILVVNFLLYLPIIPKVKAFTLWTLENSPKQLPPEQLAMTKKMIPYIAWSGGLTAILSIVLIWLFLALSLKFYNLFIGSEAPFKKLFAVGVISSVPMILGGVLKTALIMITPASGLQQVSTSAALLLSKSQMGFFNGFLSAIDPFVLWSLFLISLGGAAVLNTSAKKTGVYLGILWVIYALCLGGIAAISRGAV